MSGFEYVDKSAKRKRDIAKEGNGRKANRLTREDTARPQDFRIPEIDDTDSRPSVSLHPARSTISDEPLGRASFSFGDLVAGRSSQKVKELFLQLQGVSSE